MIQKYAILASGNYGDLEVQVNEHIKFGWQPWGSLVVVQDHSGGLQYRQAMVKEGT